MKSAVKAIRQILAIILAAAMILSPVLSRTVYADGTYTAFRRDWSKGVSREIGYYVLDEGNEVLVYCVNYENLEPEETGTSPYSKTTLTGDNIDSIVGDRNAATRDNLGLVQGEELRRKLVSIMHYGHRTINELSITAKELALNDLRLDFAATQVAIWHYTDGKTAKTWTNENINRFYLQAVGYPTVFGEDKTSEDVIHREWMLDAMSGTATSEESRAKLSEEEKALVDAIMLARDKVCPELMSKALSPEEILAYETDAYVTEKTKEMMTGKSAIGHINYQNLIALRTKPETVKKDILLSKQEAGGGAELPGAKLELYLEDGIAGDVKLDEWVSGTEPHKFKVYPGVSYKLVETQAPENYQTPTEWIVFTVDESGKATLTEGSSLGEDKDSTIVMYNSKLPHCPVSFSKKAVAGSDELPGAKIEVWKTDADGVITGTEPFASWTSGDKPHVIDEVYEGYYLMREIRSPYGYEIAEDMRFRVTDAKELLVFDKGTWTTGDHVLMEDAESPKAPVSFLKVDADTKEAVGGATMTVTLADGTEVMTWTSGTEKKTIELAELFIDADSDRKDDAEYTEYIYAEKKEPAGYEYSKETVTFRIYRETDTSGKVTAKLYIKDGDTWVPAPDTLVLTIANKKKPAPKTTPDPTPTPGGTDPTPTDPTPTTPTPTTPTPATPTPATPVTPAPAPAVLGEQRATGTDGQQTVLGARRAEARTSDDAPVRLLILVMGFAGAGLVAGIACWTRPEAVRTKKRNRRR